MLNRVKGTRDLIFDESRKFRHIEATASLIAQRYGFEEIETPILEPAGLFLRSLGDTSDIVSKEMYRFTDAGGDDLVLRPEGTAGVARAFMTEGLQQHLPLKLYYRGPMFRRERPQKGRYRQFYQFGVELLGVEKPQADIEVLSCGWRIIRALGIQGSVKLLINTLGDLESRAAYRERLTTYFSTRKSELSADSLARLEKNPLRILDSKDPDDRKLIAEAPELSESLTEPARVFFETVTAGLAKVGIPFEIDRNLVRGLDYYGHTVFEYVTDALGAQNAVLAGGRYDGLVKDLGGPATPGVGWAFGIDRMADLLPELPKRARPVAIVPMGEDAEQAAIEWAERLREAGLTVELGYSGNLAKRMKRADKLGAGAAIIMGSDELARGVVQIKDLATGAQREVSFDQVLATVKTFRL